MSNKRVSQLVEMTSGEVQSNDLFLIIDTSGKESKRIQASQLAFYLAASGSLNAIHATNADTASYVLASNIIGNVDTASYSIKSGTSITSSFSLNSLSASYALTASFALNSNVTASNSASYLIFSLTNGTASFAISSSLAQTANNAKNLVYTGAPNGTASYAITTGTVNFANNAGTASYLNGTVASVATASFAQNAAVANEALFADQAAFLIFSPNNGTASYAISAGGFTNHIIDYGIFLSNTQSLVISQLDTVDVLSSNATLSPTPIEAMGTLVIPYTSSVPLNETVYLGGIDRNTGITFVLDSSPISVNISPTVGNWDAYDTGSLKLPYSLMGQTNLYGSYNIFVSCSNKIQIESTRIGRFSIGSLSDVVNVYSSEPISFTVISPSTPITFSSNAGGPFVDTAANIVASGSSNILTINLNNSGVNSIKYVWTLKNLTSLDCSSNPALSFLSGLPNSITHLSCSSCFLSSLYELSSSVISYLDCSNNQLTSLPLLPTSMSHLNCATNSIVNLPTSLPGGLTIFRCNYNNISSIPPTPNSIVTMSISNNTSLSILSSDLPLSLTNFSCNNDPLIALPTIPSNVLELYAQSASLAQSSMGNLVSDLVSNGLSNGVLDISGNGSVLITTLNDIIILQSRGWTVYYDP